MRNKLAARALEEHWPIRDSFGGLSAGGQPLDALDGILYDLRSVHGPPIPTGELRAVAEHMPAGVNVEVFWDLDEAERWLDSRQWPAP